MRPRLIAFLLVAALLLAAGTAAAGPNDSKGWTKFTDVDGHWAQQQITKMYGAGILQGVGDGLFDPEGGMTRAQVAVMICRVLGLHDPDEGQEPVVDELFLDEASFPAWANAHIRACYEHRIMVGEVTSKGKVFNPNKPITRQEFVVLLLRAVDLEDPEDLEALAQSLMGERAQLAFKDAKAIADWAVGYVLVALEKEWVAGYTDGTFQPNKPVTRAEAATLVERLEGSLGGNWPGRHDGTVVSVASDGSALTISEEDEEGNPQETTYTIATGCKVYLDGQLESVSDLEPGWPVRVYARDGAAVYIHAESVTETLTGAITAIDADAQTFVLTLAEEGAPARTVLVEEGTAITIDTETKTFADLEAGLDATVVGKADAGQLKASSVTVTTPSP